MRKKYIQVKTEHGYKLIEGEETPRYSGGVVILDDLPAYTSPIDGRLIDGRKARREDLARSNCRPYEKGEKEYNLKQQEYYQKQEDKKIDRLVHTLFNDKRFY